MNNPLFDVLSGGNGQMLGNLGNMASLMQQFNKFKNNFKGNPQQIVQEMLNSGRLSQQQFDQVAQMATQFQRMMNKY